MNVTPGNPSAGGGGGAPIPPQVRVGGVARSRKDQAEQLRQVNLLGAAGGIDKRAACQGSDMPEIPQGFQFSDQAVNASLQAFLTVNRTVGQILGSDNPSLLDRTRSDLLTTAFPMNVRVLAQDVVREMFMCLPEPVPASDITPEHINTVVRCITDALMNDAPLTKVGTVIGNLFLSLFYGDNPVRIAAAVVHAGATGYMAWISGLNRVASLSIESARVVFLGLMAGWGYIGAPNAPVVVQQPQFQGPLPFNVSNAQAYWGQLDGADPGGFAIIEEIRVMLRDNITDPVNQLLCLTELTRRVFDHCVPVGPGFRPFQRFQNPPPGANATNFQLLVHQIRGGAITLFNFLGGLCDMVRKLPYQGVGQMGPQERSFRHYLSNQFAIMVGGMHRCLRDQAILRGFSDEQIDQIFLKSLLEFMVPPDIRDAAERGYTISVQVQLGILASKIRDVVVRCCHGAGVDENMLTEICHYFRSGLTEDALRQHVSDDFMHILDHIESAEQDAQNPDSAGGVYGGDSNPQARDEAVDKELGKLQDLGFAEVLTAREAAILKSSREKTGVVGMACTLPDIGTQFLKKRLVGGAITLGATTHAQIRALLEEAAKPQNLAMSHKYPPDPLVFLVHISAVLDVCHDACQKEQTREAVIAEIQSHLPRFGQPAAVIKFVRSIIRMSIVWSLSTNPKLFTLAIKTPRIGEPYVVLLVNFSSVKGWKTGKFGHIEREKGVFEVPLEFLGDCTRGIVESLGTRASGVLGWAKSLLTKKACAVEGGGGVLQLQPPPPGQMRLQLEAQPAESSGLLVQAPPPVMCVPPAASPFQAASPLPVVGAAAGGEMAELSPLTDKDPANAQNIAQRTLLVEESEKLLVQQDIQFCASELLRDGVKLSKYEAIPSDAAGISANPLPPNFNSFSLPTATGLSAAGGGTLNFMPVSSLPIEQSSMGPSSVLLGLGSTGESGGDMGSGRVDVLKVVDLENNAAKHLVDAAHVEDAAAGRLENVSKELIDAAKRFAHPPPLDPAVLDLPLSAGAAAAASEIPENPDEKKKRENIAKGLKKRTAAGADAGGGGAAGGGGDAGGGGMNGGRKSRKTTKRTRRNKGRKSSSKTSKKTRQRRDRRSSRHRRSSRKGRK